jgi:peptidyl-prolyl cis-trans isomerase D
MSSRLKQYIWAAAIMAIALVFVMQFRPGATQQGMGVGAPGPTCAIENDGRCIVSMSDFITAMRLASASSFENEDQRDQIRGIVIQGLIERWLLLQDAERLGIRVSDKEVTRGLRHGMARLSLPADREGQAPNIGLVPAPDGPARSMGINDPKTGEFDYQRYTKWVQRVSNKTMQDFREYATAEELAARMRALVRSRARVSEQEARAVFSQGNSKIVVDYVALDRDWFMRHMVDASSEAVAKWQADHEKDIEEAWKDKKDEFMPECRKARHILVRVDDAASDKEAAQKQAREKIDAAKKRIDKGDDFAKVARDMSEDAQSASRGGDLGCFAAGKLARPNTAKAVDDAAYATAKGKASGVIESSFGLHLVQVDDVLKGDAAEKEGKSQIARDKYLKAEGDRLAGEAAKQIHATVKEGKTLQQALDAQLAAAKDVKGDDEKPKVATSNEFSPMGQPFPGIENAGAVGRALFAIEKVGGTADVIKMYDGYAVAQLKEKKPFDEKEWDKQRQQMMQAMRAEKERDALIAYVRALKAKHVKSLELKIPLHEEREDKKGGKGKKEGPEPPPEMPIDLE